MDPWSKGGEITRGILRSSTRPGKRSISCHRRGVEILSPVFNTQRPNVFVSDTWPAPATYDRPFCKHCCPWSRVRRYIDTCRGCVCSLAAVCWLAPAYWLCCASLLLKPGNTPYPCPVSAARARVCPTWLTKQLWPLCSRSRVGYEYINAFLCYCVLAADESFSCSPAVYHLNSSNIPVKK